MDRRDESVDRTGECATEKAAGLGNPSDSEVESARLFRLWITRYTNWRPKNWNDAPPAALAIEPADAEAHTALEAQYFLEGFNSQMLESDRGLWAVSIPVELRYSGDPQPGDLVCGYQFPLAQAETLG
jgi:hypothetical protein